MSHEWGMNIRDLLEEVARIDVERLESLRAAAEEWDRFVQERFGVKVTIARAKDPTGELSDWLDDNLGDEAFRLQETKRLLCAGIAVAITSVTESFGASVCNFMGHRPAKGKDVSFSWRKVVELLEKDSGKKLSDLPGYEMNHRARLLGNCFKHSDGKANSSLEKAAGIVKGTEIAFEKEDWAKMIEDTKQFLVSLAAHVND